MKEHDMDERVKSTDIEALYEAVLKLESMDDCRAFFGDLCTRKEIESMAQRIKAAALLLSGKTYEQVTAMTEISSATLSRVSRCIKCGIGYNRFIGPSAT